MKPCAGGRWTRQMPSAILLVGFIMWIGSAAVAGPLPPDHIDEHVDRSRVFVLTDMGNEPDDQMSLVRLLLYANELDIEGLVATTSTWQKDKVHPGTLSEIIGVYGTVRDNLLKHAKGWPSADHLLGVVSQGHSVYGLSALEQEKLSPGASALIKAVDRSDDRPLWITVWGGANVLAEALSHVRSSREPSETEHFVSRMRVYAISDQDDAGPWIRERFPGLFYIVKPSAPNGTNYYYATWTGISGDEYYRNGTGADSELVSNEWLDAHIRTKGPLGKMYPEYWFIMEGDTPSFLNLLGNGLSGYQNPGWGGWGGRYLHLQPYGESRPIWSQGGDLFDRVTSQDTVAGLDGALHTSDQATIWRWREAYQQDFAARMDWTIKAYNEANHHPELVVNGRKGTAPMVIEARAGEKIRLDASLSTDPDDDPLNFYWFHYREAGYVPSKGMADIELTRADSAQTEIRVLGTCRPKWLDGFAPCEPEGTAHIILAATDGGSPALTSYRRIIVNVSPKATESVNAEAIDH